MPDVSKIVERLQYELGIEGKPASLRDTAKTLMISHATAENWLNGTVPNRTTIETIVRGLTLGLMAAKEIEAALSVNDLVVASAKEKSVS